MPSNVTGAFCQIGQRWPCREPATTVIAIMQVFDSVWAENPRRGGVVFLCDIHAQAVRDWPLAPSTAPLSDAQPPADHPDGSGAGGASEGEGGK